jgi:pimeloyl-ACP methyl ester carboxylesterase
MRSHHTNADGLSMRWLEAGEGGPPVVFLHGIPTGPRLWRHVVVELEGVRALCWEMPGYARSIDAGRGRDLAVAQQAEYLHAWMQAVDLESAIVVGHDLGGGVAQILAVRHPERVRGLVLTNAISYDSWPVAPIKAVSTGSALVERMPVEMARWAFKGLLRGGHARKGQAAEAFAEHWPPYEEAEMHAAEAFVRQAQALRTEDTLAVAGELPGLDVPARLVWGAADRFQKIGYGYRLAYDLGAELDRIESGKHFTPEDHPERVARAVRAVVEESEAKGTS